MANMSYCRFRNTKSDLEDCLDVLERNSECRGLSSDEFRAAVGMLERIFDFVKDSGLINTPDFDNIEYPDVSEIENYIKEQVSYEDDYDD